MKTILFLIPTFGGGGAERVLVNLVNNLDKKKYKVCVQTLFDTGINRQYLNEEVVYIPGWKSQFPGNVRVFRLFSPEFLYKRIIRQKYDIVVSYLEGPTARIVAGCPYDSKLVSWVHVEQKSKEAASYSYRSLKEYEKCAQRYDRTICVAETVKRDFLLTVSLEKPCSVLYNTNEDQEIVRKGSVRAAFIGNPDNIRIISVARLRYEKGFDRLIVAHKRLLEEGFPHEMFVLGEGSEREKLEKLIRENDVQNTFHLMGFDSNPYKYVSRADLYVCSSRREGFSTAVTEALILGVPVVSTNCSGAEELLGKNNEYGIVVENSEEGIYSGLKQMLKNSDLLQHYRDKAKERGRFFSKEKTVKAVEGMLDTL